MIEQEWPVCKVATAARNEPLLFSSSLLWRSLASSCSLTALFPHCSMRLMTSLNVRFNLSNGSNGTSPNISVPGSHEGKSPSPSSLVQFQSQCLKCLKQNGSPTRRIGSTSTHKTWPFLELSFYLGCLEGMQNFEEAQWKLGHPNKQKSIVTIVCLDECKESEISQKPQIHLIL